MLTAKVKSNIKFPEIKLIKELNHVAKNIIIPDIKKGILGSKSIRGGNFPDNSAATIKRKGRNKPLIDTKKLLNSFFYKTRDKFSVIISIKNIRKEIGKFLQVDGVGKSKKKFLFFGVSADAEKRAMNFMRKRLRILLHG